MPGPIRTASAAATLAFAAAPVPLTAWTHGAKPNGSYDTGHAAAAHQVAPAARGVPVQQVVPGNQAVTVDQVAPAPAWKAPQRPHTLRDTSLSAVDRPAQRHDKAGPTVRPRAHAAGDPANTISDFKFSPGTTTIHVGDTVTWTNAGPSPHTATASDGSFDTGTLSKGASASHTFAQSGSFAYICKIHPFMHGTIVVLAATTQAASGPTPATPSSAPPAPTSTPSSGPAAATQSKVPTLPVTGLAVPEIITVGLVLLALGWLLRESAPVSGRARRRPRAGAKAP